MVRGADRWGDPDLATGAETGGPRTADPRVDERYDDGRTQVKVLVVPVAKVRRARGATRR
jgi:hypothetical protein